MVKAAASTAAPLMHQKRMRTGQTQRWLRMKRSRVRFKSILPAHPPLVFVAAGPSDAPADACVESRANELCNSHAPAPQTVLDRNQLNCDSKSQDATMLGVRNVILATLGLLALVALPSDAYCPNGCNAQGTCGKNDKCTCYMRQDEGSDLTYPAYKGADCSLRTCPHGNAWVQIPSADNMGHDMAECSNKGLCDYVTGHCDCFPGYEGKACERTACPSSCNGRGICLTLKAIILNSPSAQTYAAWDDIKHMGCFCDQGYRGPDCSLKECPSGLDVLLAYGKNEGRDCGGRGKCNYDTGDCECFPGYYGTACESQTTVH